MYRPGFDPSAYDRATGALTNRPQQVGIGNFLIYSHLHECQGSYYFGVADVLASCFQHD